MVAESNQDLNTSPPCATKAKQTHEAKESLPQPETKLLSKHHLRGTGLCDSGCVFTTLLAKYRKLCEVGCKPAPNRNDQTLLSSQRLHMARQRKIRPRMLIFEKRCSSVSQNTCPIHEKRETKNSTGNVFCFYMYISRIPSPLRYLKLITELQLCLK